MEDLVIFLRSTLLDIIPEHFSLMAGRFWLSLKVSVKRKAQNKHESIMNIDEVHFNNSIFFYHPAISSAMATDRLIVSDAARQPSL